MTSELCRHRLGDVLAVVIDHRGRTPKKLGGDFVAAGVRVLSAKIVKGGRLQGLADCRFVTQDMYDAWMPNKLRLGDVLLTSEAPLGEAAYLQDDAHFCLGQRLFALRANDAKLDARFLFYLLLSPAVQQRLQARATGTTAQGIRQAELVQVEVDLPPLPEQRRVASILGALDDKIELNRRMNGTFESIARAIFKSWFIDFDPLRGKPESKTGGELGLPRDSWSRVRFSDTVEVLSGGTPRTSEPTYWGGGLPWYSVADAPSPGDVFVTHTEKTVTSEGVEHSAAQLVPELTTIVSARGTVGRCALTGREMAFNQSCFGLRPADHVGYYYTYFSTLRIVDELRRSAHGSVFSTITRPTFRSIGVMLPPARLVAEYEDTVRPLMARIRLNVDESRSLRVVRESLLPKLVGGVLGEQLLVSGEVRASVQTAGGDSMSRLKTQGV